MKTTELTPTLGEKEIRQILFELPRTLGEEEMREIFDLSRSSLYRRLRDAREGKDAGIPLPIPMGSTRRRLRWDAETVRKFCQAQNVPQPESSNVESPSKRTKRFDDAVKELEGLGVKLTQPRQ